MNKVRVAGHGGTSSTHITVMLGGQVIKGSVLSVTEMVRAHCVEFPQSSVAVHVRVTVYSCGQEPGVVTSAKVGTTDASQASVAVATPKLGAAGHSTVAGGFGHVSVGAVLSVTVMVRVHCAVLLQSSVAVQVRTTVYSCEQLPGVVTSLEVTIGLVSQLSVAVAAPKFGVAGHSIDAVGLGQVMIGGVRSSMLTTLEHVEEQPVGPVVNVSVYVVPHALFA